MRETGRDVTAEPLYGDDLAAIHAAGFSDLAQAAGRHLLDIRPPGRLLDLGCGDGALGEVTADAGFSVHGIDASPAMVELARRRVPGGRFEVGDVATTPLPAADVVAAVGEVFSYACPGGDALRAVLERIHVALAPGGLLLFDVAATGRAAQPTRAVRSGRGWRVEAVAGEHGGWLTRTIDTWRGAGGGRHRRETHRLRLFDAAEVLEHLDAAGFGARRLGGYDDFAFQQGWDGFEARRL